MAFCTRCGAKIEEGVEHQCSAGTPAGNTPPLGSVSQTAAQAQATETMQQTVAAQVQASATAPTAPVQPNQVGEWFQHLWQQLRKGVAHPDGLAEDVMKSPDFIFPIVHYVIFGVTFGLFSVAFTSKVISTLSSMADGLLSILGGSGAAGIFGLASGNPFSSSPFGDINPFHVSLAPIFFKTVVLMAIVAAAYATSFALINRLFGGKGRFLDYFKGISAALIPASLTLLVSAIVVNASIVLGVLGILVALLYVSYFTLLQAQKISGLSVAKTVYTLPLVQVIPLIVYYILSQIGL